MLQNTPGYKDKKKLKNSSDNNQEDYLSKRKAYGDLIIWKEILYKASIVNKDILFVTDDEKVDWWSFEIALNNNTDRETKILNGPHHELLQEFESYSKNKFQMLTFSDFIDYITLIHVSDSLKIHFQLNKGNMLIHYVSNQINYDGIDINYIIKDLDSFFDYEAIDYNVTIDEINYDNEDIFVDINDTEVNISGRFKIDLIVDGTIENDNQTLIKSILIEFECESNLTLKISEKDYRKYEILNGEIRVLKVINNDIIAIVSDDIDIYDLYDMKIRVEKAIDSNIEDELSDYDYKLYEAFGYIEFYSIDQVIEQNDENYI